MLYFKDFIFAFISTVGFSVFFNVPKKSIFYAGITGAVGWTVYLLIKNITQSMTFANFIGAISIGVLGEIFARLDKKPVTIFVIPGIVPLVPGYGIYLSMEKLINQDFYKAVEVGTEAIFIGGAISVGIILVSSVAKVLKKRKLKVEVNK
ncbi:threonine/serine exporter family protein [Caminicella sporogenes]|uniref:threonine/serine exporter family protein n=1 Tax=Caminicella sporogenes TaxID=166485 RepID=UPI002542445F|nr:threonine/serine exporter family protein [Caminicella sporogenes]WIF95400.1 threonine/serine exporter family protein [Caminicella sporogenes]